MERKSSADGEDNEVGLTFIKSGKVFPVPGGGVSVLPTGGIDGQR